MKTREEALSYDLVTDSISAMADSKARYNVPGLFCTTKWLVAINIVK